MSGVKQRAVDAWMNDNPDDVLTEVIRDARTALAAAQTDAAHWCEKYDGALGKLAAAERTAEARLTVTNATLARERELLGRIDAAVALAEARRVALQVLADEEIIIGGNEEGEDFVKCDRCGATDWGSEKSSIEHHEVCGVAALAMTDAEALEALRERVRAEVAEQIENYAEEITCKAKAIPMGARSGRRTFLAGCPAFDVEHFRADELVACAVFVRALAGGRKGDGNGA